MLSRTAHGLATLGCWLALGTGASGCYAAHEAGAGARGRASPDAGRSRDGGELPAAPAAPRWASCRVATRTHIATSDTFSPDVCWLDGRMIVVSSGLFGQATLQTLDAEGLLLHEEILLDAGESSIECHREAHRALVAVGTSLRWLDAEGRLVGERALLGPARSLPGADDAILGIEVVVRPEGFGLVTGLRSYSSSFGASLRYAPAPLEPVAEVTLDVLDPAAPRRRAVHATSEDGLSTLFVSGVWHAGTGEVWELAGGAPRMFARIPRDAIPLGVARTRVGRTTVLWAGADAVLLRDLDAGSDEVLASGDVDELADAAALARVGDDLVHTTLGIPSGERARRLVIAPAVPVPDGAIALGSPDARVSEVRIAPTPTGLLVVWGESHPDRERSVELAALDCAP